MGDPVRFTLRCVMLSLATDPAAQALTPITNTQNSHCGENLDADALRQDQCVLVRTKNEGLYDRSAWHTDNWIDCGSNREADRSREGAGRLLGNLRNRNRGVFCRLLPRKIVRLDLRITG